MSLRNSSTTRLRSSTLSEAASVSQRAPRGRRAVHRSSVTAPPPCIHRRLRFCAKACRRRKYTLARDDHGRARVRSPAPSTEHEGVLRYYELAKRPSGRSGTCRGASMPPIPETKGSPQKQARRARPLALGHHPAVPGGRCSPSRWRRSSSRSRPTTRRSSTTRRWCRTSRATPRLAQARRRGRRHRRARPISRQARAHVARGRHARGEGLPDAGVLRAADHRALPADRAFVARHGARGSVQPARDRRRDPSRRGDGLRARPAARARARRRAAARRGGERILPIFAAARAVATEGARVDRPRDGVARHRALERGPGERGAPRESLGLDVSDVEMPSCAGRDAHGRPRARRAHPRRGGRGRAPSSASVGLATVLVGDDPASHIYITLKHKAGGRGRHPARSTTGSRRTRPRRSCSSSCGS